MFVPESASTISELVSWCGNDEIIVYGTGKIGKLMIPYLQRNTELKILGVTNSHIKRDDEATFLDTRLPMRSPETWYNQFPKATILITVVRQDFQYEIARICKEIGFQKILGVDNFIEPELLFDKLNTLLSLESKSFLELLIPHIGSYLVDQICIANEIQDIHKASFAEFRGCHKNQSVAVVGAGPSLNYYTQMEGVPHIGVNRTFLKPGIKLDYYFLRDCSGVDAHQKDSWLNKLKNYSFVKFFGTAETSSESRNVYRIPENLIEENHGRKFASQPKKEFIHCDIEHYPLMGLGSIIFAAIHFALYTSAKHIYVIGCDCSTNGHYDMSDDIPASTASVFADNWKWVKWFTERFYPGTEIVSVNPVGLKGLFREVYTEAYLEAHPELDWSTCEMLGSIEF